MARLSFKKSTRRRGFDPIKVPDQTQKFINESNRTLQGMQAAQGQLRRNQENSLNAIKEKQYKEERWRDKTFNLQQDWQEEFNKAELVNYQTEIDNAKLKAKEAEKREQNHKELWSLIPKAIAGVAKAQQIGEERIQGLANSIVSSSPLTFKELDIMEKYALGLEVNESQLNIIKERFRNTLDELDIKHSVGESAKVLAASKGLMMTNAAKQAGPSLFKTINADNPNEGPNDVCLNGIGTNGGVTCFSHIVDSEKEVTPDQLKTWKLGYVDKWRKDMGFENVDDKFFRLNATPHLLKGLGVAEATWRHNQLGLAEKKRNDDRVVVLRDLLTGADGKWVDNSLAKYLKMYNPTGDSEKNVFFTEEYIRTVAHGVRTREFNNQDVDRILSQEMYLGTKPLKPGEARKSAGTLGHLNPDKIEPIRRAQREVVEKKEIEDAHAKEQSEISITSWYHTFVDTKGRRPTDEERRMQMSKISKKSGYDYTQHPFYKDTVRSISRENSFKLVEERRKSGDLTLQWLYSSPHIDDSIIPEVAPTLKEYTQNEEFQKSSWKGLSNTIASKLDTEIADPENRTFQTTTITGIAKKAFNQRVHEAVKNNTYGSYHQAIVEVGKQMEKEIEKGIGIFKVSTSILGENRGFALLNKKASRIHKQIGEKALKNKDQFLAKGHKVLSPQLIAEIKQYAEAGEHHPVIRELDGVYSEYTPTTIRNKLLENHGEKAIEPSKWDRFEYYVTPELRGLLTNKPSLSKLTRAVVLTGEGAGQPDPLIPILQAQENQLTNFRAQRLGIDSYETVNSTTSAASSGETINKLPLKDTPADVIIQKGKLGVIKEIGPFNLDFNDIRKAIDDGIIDEDTPLNKETQQLIQRKKIQRESGVLQSKTSTGSMDILGVGQHHVFNMKASKISKLGLDFASLKDKQMETNTLLDGNLEEQNTMLYFLATQYPWLKTGQLMDGISTELMGAK